MLAGARDILPEEARERSPGAAARRPAEPHVQAAQPRLVTLVTPARSLLVGTVLRARGLSEAACAEPSLAWAPSENDDDAWSFVGWGTAAQIDGSGDDRLAQVRDGAARLFARIDRAELLPFAPRLFGGFAFDARQDDRAADLARAWQRFGAASFVLPHILYATNADRAFLAAFTPEDRAAEVQARLDEMRLLLEVQDMSCPHPPAPAVPAPPPNRSRPLAQGAVPDQAAIPDSRSSHGHGEPPVEPAPRAAGDHGEDPARRAWIDLITRALSEIDRGAFAKVVLSRTRRIAGARVDPRGAFAFVEPRHPGCARFFFARGGEARASCGGESPTSRGVTSAPSRDTVTFLGATPERLLSVRGRRALTEALAGSIPRGAAGDDERARAELLASDKDRAEHAFVVDAIRSALAPLCETIAIPDAPHVRSLAHVHHLATPIAATLRDHAHLLDLAARLHPTPALCGSPTEAARAFLLAGEAEPRGWYGGAVGWLDAAGDGALAVAIRSALVTPSDAWIYAGAGIVRGSDPEMEYKETAVKERAMLDALEVGS